MQHHNRRNFIKLSALTAGFLGLGLKSSFGKNEVDEAIEKISKSTPSKGRHVQDYQTTPIENVKVAFIGLGNRGQNHVAIVDALHPKASIVALCDIRTTSIEAARALIKNQSNSPAVYGGSSESWKVMLDRETIDLVVISTPWNEHVPMALTAMQHEVHVAMEVPRHIFSGTIVGTSGHRRSHATTLYDVGNRVLRG